MNRIQQRLEFLLSIDYSTKDYSDWGEVLTPQLELVKYLTEMISYLDEIASTTCLFMYPIESGSPLGITLEWFPQDGYPRYPTLEFNNTEKAIWHVLSNNPTFEQQELFLKDYTPKELADWIIKNINYERSLK